MKRRMFEERVRDKIEGGNVDHADLSNSFIPHG